MHFIADDLGCLSAVCDCASDAWFDEVFPECMEAIERHLRLRAEFQQYLADKGEVE